MTPGTKAEVSVMRKRACVLLLTCLGLSQGAGCIFFATGPGDDTGPCEASMLCQDNDPDVCGEDGDIYDCAELASCEAVGIDDTGAACGEEFCGSRPPVGCGIVCATGFRRDGDGCQLCECEVPIVCSAKPNCPGGADPAIAGYDANDCPRYYCPPR